MDVKSVKVSVTPLLSPDLTTTAQVVYAAVCQDADMDFRLLLSPTRLGRALGLSRLTVRRSLAQLAQVGYLHTSPDHHNNIPTPRIAGRRVTMPFDLLINTRVSAQAKVLYGVLQTLRYQGTSGQCKYTELARLVHRNVKTVRSAFSQLVQLGWLKATQANRKAPISFEVRHPITDRVIAEAIAAQTRIEQAPFKGEAIGREWLSLLATPTDYSDNAHLQGLRNPITDAPLEIDRNYGCGIAIEFNGPQHFGSTDRYTKDESITQQIRDAIKIAVCMRQGIKLIEILPSDLSLEGILKKIGNLLPLRNLYGYQPMVTMLESFSRQYRKHARNWMPLGLEKTFGKALTAE